MSSNTQRSTPNALLRGWLMVALLLAIGCRSSLPWTRLPGPSATARPATANVAPPVATATTSPFTEAPLTAYAPSDSASPATALATPQPSAPPPPNQFSFNPPPFPTTVLPVSQSHVGPVNFASAAATQPAQVTPPSASLSPELAFASPAVRSPAVAPDVGAASQSGSRETPPTPQPTMTISGVLPGQGTLKIAVFHSAEGFPDSRAASWTHHLPATQSIASFPLPSAQPCAVAIYQDLNGDNQLNRNRYGLPLEPYGFSNNARSRRGPPEFKDAQITPSASTASAGSAMHIALEQLQL